MGELNNHYRTSDTALAAYLQTEGFAIIGQDNTSPRVIFIVGIAIDNPTLTEKVGLFYVGKARVEPTLFLRNYRILAKQARDGGEPNGNHRED